MTESERKIVLTEVKELLNKAMILMKDVKEPEGDDYYGDGLARNLSQVPLDKYGEPDSESDEYWQAPKKDQELECLKFALEKTILRDVTDFVERTYFSSDSY